MGATLRGNLNVLGVLPTGGGKSMACWAGLVSGETELTIVVFPLVALLADQVSRLTTMFPRSSASGSKWRLWDSETRMRPGVVAQTNLLLVDVSSARQPEFLQLVASNRRIKRIVFDECSLYQECSFRKGFNTLPLLINSLTTAQLVFLSATVAPSSELGLLRALGSVKTTVVRMPTVRQNLTLNVELVGNVDQNGRDVHKQLKVKQALGAIREGTLAIVYVLSKAAGTALGPVLQQHLKCMVEFYHSDLHSTAKKQIVSRWKSGRNRVLIATSGFAYGIDVAHVSTIIHLGGSYSLAEYAQAAGRAGRDGSAATSTVVATRSDLGALADGDLRELLAQSTQCRRLALSRVLDGPEMADRFGTCGHCDVCAHRDFAVGGLAATEVQEMMTIADFDDTQQATAAERVKTAERAVVAANQLKRVGEDQCVFCFALKGAKVAVHTMVQCPLWRGRCFRCADSRAHRRQDCEVGDRLAAELQRVDCCVTCALPVFAFSKTVHDGQGSVGSGCKFKDTVLPLALLLGQMQPRWVSAHVSDVTVRGPNAYARWLTCVRDGMSNAGLLVSAWIAKNK